MELSFLNDNQIDNGFNKIASDYLFQLEAKYTSEELKKIDFDKLLVLLKALEDFMPKSHIRSEKKDFLLFLRYFLYNSIDKHSYKELLELKSKYILGLISGTKLRGKGFELKRGWIGGLIFILPIDIILWFFVGKYYYYIPIVSIPFMIIQLRKEIKAKAENKLW